MMNRKTEPYRNAHGVELKPGNWFMGADEYGHKEGIIDRVVNIKGEPTVVYATAQGERPVLTILADNVFSTLGPMIIEGDGTVKQNPAPRSLVNRWGTRLRVGQLVSVQAARGGRYEARIAGFATTGDFVRAYGRQVVSDTGGTFGVDDVHSVIEEAPRKNPLTRVKVKSPAQRGGAAPDARLTKRRKVTQKAPPGFYANPTPRLSRADQDSQREHFNPKTGRMTKRATPRLKERRALTHYQAKPGVWANPIGKQTYLYAVFRMASDGTPAYFMRAFRTQKEAREYGQGLADKGGVPYGVIKKPL
jgi:hypothetical protein